MRLTLLAATTLALAACSPPVEPAAKDQAVRSPPAALSGVDLTKPVRVGGNEPFWAIELASTEIIYTGVDRPEQRAPKPAPLIQGTVATYEATTTVGNPIKITLTATRCSDGMSDRDYPLSAVVEIAGETLTGCAISASAFASGGEGGAETGPT